MKWIRRLFGLDFPDPQVGQVWRSRHSGRAFRVDRVQLSDDGTMWHVTKRHQTDDGGFNGIAMSYCYYPDEWRGMLRREGREQRGQIPPKAPPREPLRAEVTLRGGPVDGTLFGARELTTFFEVPTKSGGSVCYRLVRAEYELEEPPAPTPAPPPPGRSEDWYRKS